MKHIFYIIIYLSLLPLLLKSQERRNSISTNILNPVVSIMPIEYIKLDFKYERFINPRFSLVFKIDHGDYYQYRSISYCYYELLKLKYKGTSLTTEARWYINKSLSQKGLVIGVHVKNMIINEDYYYEDGYNNTVSSNKNHYLPGLGVNIAYRFKYNKIYVEPLIGFGYCYKNSLGSNDKFVGIASNPYLWPFMVKIECNIGLEF